MREPLRKRLEVAAKKRGVSLNAELISRLEHSFQIESFEEVAEAQRAEIKRWAERWEASEKRFAESEHLHKIAARDWQQFSERVIQKLKGTEESGIAEEVEDVLRRMSALETSDFPKTLPSTTRSMPNERPHHQTRKK